MMEGWNNGKTIAYTSEPIVRSFKSPARHSPPERTQARPPANQREGDGRGSGWLSDLQKNFLVHSEDFC